MNFDNNIPIYVQVADLIRVKIITGEYNSGEKLLSVRDLAIMMKVNPNTVQKALQILEDEKLIFTERTNGKFVTEDQKLILNTRNKLAVEKAKIYVDCLKSLGFDYADALRFLESGERK